jgi:hypothetical protein
LVSPVEYEEEPVAQCKLNNLKIRKRIELLDSIHVVTAVMNALLVTRDEDLRRKIEDVVFVKKPEDVLKELQIADYCAVRFLQRILI